MQSSKSVFDALKLKYPIKDLGTFDDRLEGIFSPGISDTEIANHIHDTFLSRAEEYSAFCPINRPLIDHWKDLIRSAIGKELKHKGLCVVDIGSGSGTSIFPLLELLDQPQIIASDLSLPMLAQMRNLARRDGYTSLTILQMNAEDMIFEDSQIDIVSGAHVLHHALSLEKLFQEIRRVLKPDGFAVFWEPFEDGAQLLASLFDIWMEMNKFRITRFSSGVIDAMKAFTADLVRRKGRSKSIELLNQLDDKWFFTNKFIKDIAFASGFSSCVISNVYSPNNILWQMADHELRRWGFGLNEVPEWAREKLRSIQSRYSDDYLNSHQFSASIVLR